MEPLPPPVPFAHPADMVRAHQKDEQCRGELRRHVCGALEEVLGHRRFAPWQKTAALLADCAYAVATAVLSGRTLGEEYCELLIVTTTLGRASSGRRLAAAALALLPIAALSRYNPVEGGGATQPRRRKRGLSWVLTKAAEATPVVLRIHLAVFYLFGAFRLLSNRFVGLRALSLSDRPYKNFSYRPLGLLLALQVLGQACANCLEWRRQRQGSAAEEAQKAAEAVAAMSAGPSLGKGLGYSSGANGERTPMCLICMCPTDCATAAPCGHLFCWDCIASWCALKASCPLCRASVLPQQLLPLCHYEAPPREDTDGI